MSINNLDWAEAMNCAVTVCDAEGTILYMNSKSRETFASHGDLIGKNLFECHSEPSQAKIRHMACHWRKQCLHNREKRPS